MKNAGYRLAELRLHLIDTEEANRHALMKHDGEHRVATQAYLLHYDDSRLQSEENRIQSEDVSFQKIVFYRRLQMFTHLCLVVGVQRRADTVLQLGVEFTYFFLFRSQKFESFCHNSVIFVRISLQRYNFLPIYFFFPIKVSNFEA